MQAVILLFSEVGPNGSSISGSSSRQIGERHEIAELNCGKLQLGE